MRNKNAETIERKALIFNVQKYNMYDGPGVRTMVFFKGCPLRCKWCANPEGVERKYQVVKKHDICVNCGSCVPVCPVSVHTVSPVVSGEKQHRVNRGIDCIGCRKCEEACLISAISIAGEQKSISELLLIIEEDKAFYDMSGGGVTLGGGEPLMQPEAAENLLMACKQRGINTAVETCGYAKLEHLLRAAKFTDLFLFDIKHMDPERHFELTGVRNQMILENLRELFQGRYNVKIRIPILKNVNDKDADIKRIIDFLVPFRDYKNFKGIDLLPYHKLGVHKYKQLDMEYRIKDDPVLSEKDLKRIESRIMEHKLPVGIMRH